MNFHPSQITLRVACVATNNITYIQFGDDPTLWCYTSEGKFVAAFFLPVNIVQRSYTHPSYVRPALIEYVQPEPQSIRTDAPEPQPVYEEVPEPSVAQETPDPRSIPVDVPELSPPEPRSAPIDWSRIAAPKKPRKPSPPAPASPLIRKPSPTIAAPPRVPRDPSQFPPRRPPRAPKPSRKPKPSFEESIAAVTAMDSSIRKSPPAAPIGRQAAQSPAAAAIAVTEAALGTIGHKFNASGEQLLDLASGIFVVATPDDPIIGGIIDSAVHVIIDAASYGGLNLHSRARLPQVIPSRPLLPPDDTQLPARAGMLETDGPFAWFEMHAQEEPLSNFFGVLQTEPASVRIPAIHHTPQSSWASMFRRLLDPNLHSEYGVPPHEMPIVLVAYARCPDLYRMFAREVARHVSHLPSTSRDLAFTNEHGPTRQRTIILRCGASYRGIVIWNDGPSDLTPGQIKFQREARASAILKNMRMHLGKYSLLQAKINGGLPAADRESIRDHLPTSPAALGASIAEFVGIFRVPSSYLAGRLLTRYSASIALHNIAISTLPNSTKLKLRDCIASVNAQYEQRNLLLLGNPLSALVDFDSIYALHRDHVSVVRAVTEQLVEARANMPDRYEKCSEELLAVINSHIRA